jgi:protein-S-isoprenylcysteine O-methyltransferase Ste14
LVVCWVLTGFAVATGMIMVRREDRELEQRFGERYRAYRQKVPSVIPKI